MTVVVAMWRNGVGAVASERQTTNGYLGITEAVPKIWRTEAGILTGMRGQAVVAMAMVGMEVPPPTTKPGVERLTDWTVADTFEWGREVLVPAVKDRLKAWDLLGRAKGVPCMGKEDAASDLLCLVGRDFVTVSHDFTVMVPRVDFWAVGGGAEYALGALHALESVEDKVRANPLNDLSSDRDYVEVALRTAVGAAIRFGIDCGPPVDVMFASDD